MDNKIGSAKKNNQDDINLRNYRDVEGESLRRVNFGLWFLKNRRVLFLSLIAFLIVLSLGLYFGVFYNFYSYIKNRPAEIKSLEELSTVTVDSSASKSAVALKVGGPESFFANNKYDFIAKVENPNDNFFSYISYCFLDGEKELACSGSNILPQEKKYVAILSVETESRVNNLKFVVKSINWQRVDFKKYGDWKKYYQERANFVVSDTKFETVKPSDLGLKSSNNLSFNIKNNSSYNYWEVPLLIVLFSGERVVGVNKYTVYEFMSLESKSINLSWSNSVSSVDKVEIIPELNILSEDNYIKYK